MEWSFFEDIFRYRREKLELFCFQTKIFSQDELDLFSNGPLVSFEITILNPNMSLKLNFKLNLKLNLK